MAVFVVVFVEGFGVLPLLPLKVCVKVDVDVVLLLLIALANVIAPPVEN